MRVLGYKGVSLLSRLIQWRTWSPWTHVAIELDTGEVIDAWKEGVRLIAHPYVGHDPETIVEAFSFDHTRAQYAAISDYLMGHLGSRYDYRAVLRFISRRDPQRENGAYFCSELVALAFVAAGIPLQERAPAHRLSPGDLMMSPRLAHAGYYGTADDYFVAEPEALVRQATMDRIGDKAARIYRAACRETKDGITQRHGGTEKEAHALRASVALCEMELRRHSGTGSPQLAVVAELASRHEREP